jgi:hypothetical protein
MVTILPGIATLAATSLLATLVFADQENPDLVPAKSKPDAAPLPVVLTVKTNKKSYTAKEPIHVALTVSNPKKTGAKTVTLSFSSGQQYDLELWRGPKKSGEKVWQWAQGKMFTMMLTSRKLDPGKSHTYKETYDPAKLETPALLPGTYRLIATLTTIGDAPRPRAETTFTVK